MAGEIMDFTLRNWPSYCEDEWWRQWATHGAGELSLSAHWLENRAEWRCLLGEKVRELLGWKLPVEFGEFDAQLIGQKDAQGFSIQKVAFPSVDGVVVPAYVCVPHNNENPLPALVINAERDTSAAAVVGLMNEHNPALTIGSALAWNGYVVCCIDGRGYGERRRSDFAAQASEWLGISTVGCDAADLSMAFEMLSARYDVDSERIGILGIGTGMAAAMYAAIVQEGYFATALCGGVTRYRQILLSRSAKWHGEVSEMLRGTVPPGLLRYADMEDLVGLIAPRALCLSQCGGGVLPLEPAADVARQAEDIYEEFGERFRLTTEITEEVCEYPGTIVLQFLEDWLKLPERGAAK